MKDMNTQIKMKVLQDLKKHLDGGLGERLKPKKAVSIEAVSVKPAEGTPQEELREPMADKIAEGDIAPPKQPGLEDGDAQRLMDLYSKIK